MCVRVYPGEERVEAVHLLPLSNIGVVLCDALQCQLLHQINLVGLFQILRLEEGKHIDHRADCRQTNTSGHSCTACSNLP